MKTLNPEYAMLSLIAFTCLSMNVWAQKEEGHKNRKAHPERYGHYGKHHDKTYLSKNDLLSNKINRVTQADSLQAMRMKPIIDKSAERLNMLQRDFQQKKGMVMDSLKLQLKSILKEDQLHKFDEFNKTIRKNHWR